MPKYFTVCFYQSSKRSEMLNRRDIRLIHSFLPHVLSNFSFSVQIPLSLSFSLYVYPCEKKIDYMDFNKHSTCENFRIEYFHSQSIKLFSMLCENISKFISKLNMICVHEFVKIYSKWSYKSTVRSVL